MDGAVTEGHRAYRVMKTKYSEGLVQLQEMSNGDEDRYGSGRAIAFPNFLDFRMSPMGGSKGSEGWARPQFSSF
jgi:hypothetical protein